MKKTNKFAIVVSVVALVLIVLWLFIHQSFISGFYESTPEPSETEIWERREAVVAEILSGELQPDETGIIELPDAEQYHEISDSDRGV